MFTRATLDATSPFALYLSIIFIIMLRSSALHCFTAPRAPARERCFLAALQGPGRPGAPADPAPAPSPALVGYPPTHAGPSPTGLQGTESGRGPARFFRVAHARACPIIRVTRFDPSHPRWAIRITSPAGSRPTRPSGPSPTHTTPRQQRRQPPPPPPPPQAPPADRAPSRPAAFRHRRTRVRSPRRHPPPPTPPPPRLPARADGGPRDARSGTEAADGSGGGGGGGGWPGGVGASAAVPGPVGRKQRPVHAETVNGACAATLSTPRCGCDATTLAAAARRRAALMAASAAAAADAAAAARERSCGAPLIARGGHRRALLPGECGGVGARPGGEGRRRRGGPGAEGGRRGRGGVGGGAAAGRRALRDSYRRREAGALGRGRAGRRRRRWESPKAGGCCGSLLNTSYKVCVLSTKTELYTSSFTKAPAYFGCGG
jgi:hypothetical protein